MSEPTEWFDAPAPTPMGIAPDGTYRDAAAGGAMTPPLPQHPLSDDVYRVPSFSDGQVFVSREFGEQDPTPAEVRRYVESQIARAPRVGPATDEVRLRSAGPGSAAGAALRSPADLQAKADAFAAEHGLTLPPGMVWSFQGMNADGDCIGVLAVHPPGFPKLQHSSLAEAEQAFDVAYEQAVTPSGYRHGSEAWRHRRRVLRRHLARCRAVAVLCAVAMVGAFAADRPVAGVLASMLVFMLLRAAAETRAEL